MATDSPPHAAARADFDPLDPPGRAALAHAWNHQRRDAIALLIASGLLLVVLVAVIQRVSYHGRVFSGVQVAGTDLGHATERDALHTIQDLGAQLRQAPVHAHAGTQDLSFDPRAIGFRVDAAATVRAARRDGRALNPIDSFSGMVLRTLRPDDVDLVVRYNPTLLAGVIDGWVGATGKGLVDGGLSFDGTQVAEVRPRSGIGIDRADAERRVLAALRHGSSTIGRIRIGPTAPTIDFSEVHRAARRARAILSVPVTITSGTARVTLTPDQIATALRTEIRGNQLMVRVDTDALRAAISPALATIETQPKDAGFAIDGAHVSVVPAIVGQTLALEPVAAAIASGTHAVTARVHTTPPARTTEWAQKLNITELVSSFTTNHPCCQPRVTNIHRAADTVNGTIVEPGVTFSLNDALGPRTAEKGYVLAHAIGANLEFEDAIGGGVSQLSTTIYNATFFGCYQDVTHTVHALYITRYPMGREATLNYPSIDNKFRNDSHSGILIRTSYTGTSLTVSFYGNKEGRSCRAEGPNILQTIPIEPDYVDDPTLPIGTLKETAPGTTGYVVENFRIISRVGQPDIRERYLEHYSMAKAKVARGTGPPLPAPPVTPPVPTP